MTNRLPEYIQRAFSRLGLTKRDFAGLPPVWAESGQGDALRFIAPQIKKRAGGHQLVGVIGVLVPEFEEWWRGVLDAAPLDGKASDTFLFGLFLTNLAPLMDVPTLDQGDGADAWLSAIWKQVVQLPDSLDEILKAQRAEHMIGLPFRAFLGHPVKVLAFHHWLTLRGLEPYGSAEIYRVEPYSAAFRELERLGARV